MSLLLVVASLGLGVAMSLKGLRMASQQRSELRRSVGRLADSAAESGMRDVARQLLAYLERPENERLWRWLALIGLWWLGLCAGLLAFGGNWSWLFG